MKKLTRDDVMKYIIKIQLNFENAYVTTNDLERSLLLESWYEALCDYPEEICNHAVNDVLKRAKFAPRIGEIVEQAEKLMHPQQKSDEELWAELTNCLNKVYEISRYLPYPQYSKWTAKKLNEIYSGLDEQLKLYAVNVSTLVELSEMTAESLQYERTRFFKQMPVLRQHAQDKADAQKFLDILETSKGLTSGVKQLNDKKKNGK